MDICENILLRQFKLHSTCHFIFSQHNTKLPACARSEHPCGQESKNKFKDVFGNISKTRSMMQLFRETTSVKPMLCCFEHQCFEIIHNIKLAELCVHVQSAGGLPLSHGIPVRLSHRILYSIALPTRQNRNSQMTISD